MIHFDLPKQKSSIIKVIGMGGGGTNAVNFMFGQDNEGVDFVICNTDAKSIEQSPVMNKIQLGPFLTQGLGAGANPEVGKAATEESLQEIKSILEVNTKMAFITAGMGGGTGTGGAPIVAQICKELGILTVGIVTTPFGFEGPRRMQQAEDGIKALKPYVDTLLVISNDKLRMQYGNLKMKEAFAKADNVLATAAKCITDIINSRGHIIVDFADVCTVMKNGGVAHLGSSAVEGENRAQLAIEEALDSPLLNDSDIKGAKWILININSAEGDHECSMDEVEIISNYLRMQAGEHSDVIMGMGYDNTLGAKLSITLIVTGFEHTDPFRKQVEAVKPEPKEEKILMPLNLNLDEHKMVEQPQLTQQPIPFEDKQTDTLQLNEEMHFSTLLTEEPIAPVAVIEHTEIPAPVVVEAIQETPAHTGLTAWQEELLDVKETEIFALELSDETAPIAEITTPEVVEETPTAPIVATHVEDTISAMDIIEREETTTQAPFSFLSRPTNIYNSYEQHTEQQYEAPAENTFQLTLHEAPEAAPVEEEETFSFELTETEVPAVETPVAEMHHDIDLSEEEEQRKRASERIQKLRNLSFNMNDEPGKEFDEVPAYVRRNVELFGTTLASVEDFYSKYTVSKDENNETSISSLNTFLEGKKPD